MYFNLTNGKSVMFHGNTSAARFIYLAMPFQGLRFKEDEEKPKIKMTPEVREIIRISEKFRERRRQAALEIERQCFDDDIPF